MPFSEALSLYALPCLFWGEALFLYALPCRLLKPFRNYLPFFKPFLGMQFLTGYEAVSYTHLTLPTNIAV